MEMALRISLKITGPRIASQYSFSAAFWPTNRIARARSAHSGKYTQKRTGLIM